MNARPALRWSPLTATHRFAVGRVSCTRRGVSKTDALQKRFEVNAFHLGG